MSMSMIETSSTLFHKHEKSPQEPLPSHLTVTVRLPTSGCSLFARFSRTPICQAHAHFIGVAPAHRGAGLGAMLYDHFFRAVRARGCTLVHAVTDPCNTSSVAFHMALGFEPQRVADPLSGGGHEVGGGAVCTSLDARACDENEEEVASGHQSSALAKRPSGDVYVRGEFVHLDYDGPDDGNRVVLEKRL